MKEEKEEEVVEESWRRWRCDGRGKICLVDMAHSGKYSQLDKAGKGGRNEGRQTNLTQRGVGLKIATTNLESGLFPVNLVCSGGMKGHWVGGAVWLFCLSKEIGERLLPLEREEIGKNTGI